MLVLAMADEGTGDWGLGTGDWGLGTEDWVSERILCPASPTPYSPLPLDMLAIVGG